MKLRRNDPCHCGSGKKYKQCHLKVDASRVRQQQELRSVHEWVAFHARALRESVREKARAEGSISAAATAFFDGAGPEDPLKDPGFEQHAVYDLDAADGPLVLQGDPGEAAEEGEKLREALAATFPTLLEVVECQRGKGLRLKDRLNDVERFVGEPALAASLEPMEVVVGRLLQFRDRWVLHSDWEKVGFRGRKAVLRDFEEKVADLGEDDDEARHARLKTFAPALYLAARAPAVPTAP